MTLGAVSFSALGRPSTLAGGIPYADGTEYALLPAGTSGQVLQSNGAAAPSWGPASAVQTTNTDTGTKNDWAPGMSGGLTIQPWNGAADLTVTGLSGLATGAIWIFKNIGTKNAYFTHLGGGSTAAHQFTNAITSGNGTPVAPNGFIAYYNDGTNLKLIGHSQGAWITPAYNAGDFAGNVTTWGVDAGDIQSYRYRVRDNELTIILSLFTTSVGTGNNKLNLTVPNGFTVAGDNLTLSVFARDNGVSTTGYTFADPAFGGPTIIGISRFDEAAWTACTNNTQLFCLPVIGIN